MSFLSRGVFHLATFSIVKFTVKIVLGLSGLAGLTGLARIDTISKDWQDLQFGQVGHPETSREPPDNPQDTSKIADKDGKSESMHE